jgi:hypothetical protein
MPDVVPYGGKVPRSVSPPASRGDGSSPVGTGVKRTVVVICAINPTVPGFQINESLIKMCENEPSLIVTLSHGQYLY